MSAETVAQANEPGWVSQRAIAWAIDDAPCPAELLATLIIIARRCDENGKGSFQSKQTMGEKTGKSEDQISRDIKELLKLELIRLGDQTLPGRYGFKPGQWPTVYDVALEKKGAKPSRRSKNPTGRKKPDEAGPGETPRMDAGGGMDAPDTPRMDASQTPRMDAPLTRLINKTFNNPLSLSARTSVTDAGANADEDRERDKSDRKSEPEDRRHRIVAEAGSPSDRAPQVADHLDQAYAIDTIGWYIRAASNGTLPDRVAEAIDCIDRPQHGCVCNQSRRSQRPTGSRRLTNSHADPSRYFEDYQPYRDPRAYMTDEEMSAEYSGAL